MSPILLFPKKPIHIFWSLETTIYLLITMAGIIIFILRRQDPELRLALVYVFMSASAFIIIGLIVPNASAIIRYRIIFLPLFLLPFMEQIILYIKSKNI
jgi:hypothetical protein